MNIRETVEAGAKAFATCFGNSDTAGITSIYTEDGKLVPPNLDFVIGTADMQKFWDAHPDLGAKTLTLKTIEVEEHDDTAIELGEYDLGQGLDRGKYMIIWKCVDGTWKMHHDMWNSSLPVPE